jgi:hypothetical protein
MRYLLSTMSDEDIVTTMAVIAENSSETIDIGSDIAGTRVHDADIDVEHENEKLPAISAQGQVQAAGASQSQSQSQPECDHVVAEGKRSENEPDGGQQIDIDATINLGSGEDCTSPPNIDNTQIPEPETETQADASTPTPNTDITTGNTMSSIPPKGGAVNVDKEGRASNTTTTDTAAAAYTVDATSTETDKTTADGNNNTTAALPTSSSDTTQPLAATAVATFESAPVTPQELHKQIKDSRDKLFFIAHSEPPGSTKKWYLVRADLASSGLDEETQDCKNTGKYYVEHYTKASYDRGILLAGYPLEDGIPAVQMKAKPDSESRYWLEWHEFHYDKNEEMVLGKWKEFPPNTVKEINRRLMNLSRKSLGQSTSDESASDDEVERHRFEKYTIWANVANLMDDETRLVGPFDFEDTKVPPLTEEDLAPYDEATKKLFVENHVNLIVKDRVPLSRWQELLEALKGRDICPPTVVAQKSKEKTTNKLLASVAKRVCDEGTSTSVKRPRANPSYLVCQECQTSDEGKGKLLVFPATSRKAYFCIHVSCAKQNKKNNVISRDGAKRDIYSLLDSTLSQTRRARVGHGYYMINELRDTLHEAVDKWVGELNNLPASSSRIKKPPKLTPPTRVQQPMTHRMPSEHHHTAIPQSLISTSCEPIQGLSIADFTNEEIDSFPVAYAYYPDDPTGVSEENAKIATLNHGVKERQLRRNSGPIHSSNTTSHPIQPGIFRQGVPVNHELLAQHSPEPAEGLPEGWIVIQKKRKIGVSKAVDKFWYSPNSRYMFRSRPEVHRFLEALKESDGDESKAIEALGIGKKRNRKH